MKFGLTDKSLRKSLRKVKNQKVRSIMDKKPAEQGKNSIAFTLSLSLTFFRLLF